MRHQLLSVNKTLNAYNFLQILWSGTNPYSYNRSSFCVSYFTKQLVPSFHNSPENVFQIFDIFFSLTLFNSIPEPQSPRSTIKTHPYHPLLPQQCVQSTRCLRKLRKTHLSTWSSRRTCPLSWSSCPLSTTMSSPSRTSR